MKRLNISWTQIDCMFTDGFIFFGYNINYCIYFLVLVKWELKKFTLTKIVTDKKQRFWTDFKTEIPCLNLSLYLTTKHLSYGLSFPPERYSKIRELPTQVYFDISSLHVLKIWLIQVSCSGNSITINFWWPLEGCEPDFLTSQSVKFPLPMPIAKPSPHDPIHTIHNAVNPLA